MSRPKKTPKQFDVLTWDPDKQEFSPQHGIKRGPYTRQGVIRVLRKLRNMGYNGTVSDPFIRIDER